MKSLINFVFVSSVVAATVANTIVRVAPKPPASGWTVPQGQPPSISVNLTADVLMTTFGFTGGADSSQQIAENASGSSGTPALIVSSSSNSATAGNSGSIEAVALVEVPEEQVSTLNEVDTQFIAAGVEEVSAVLHGVNASFEYSGESAVPLGGGVTLAEASTDVEIVSASDK